MPEICTEVSIYIWSNGVLIPDQSDSILSPRVAAPHLKIHLPLFVLSLTTEKCLSQHLHSAETKFRIASDRKATYSFMQESDQYIFPSLFISVYFFL